MTPDERMIEIETKISYQEFLVEKLNEVIVQQQEAVTRLEDTLNALVKRVANGAREPEIGPANEKPPHY